MTSTGQTESGRAISEIYFAAGCIGNLAGTPEIPAPEPAINQHPVFDAMRRWSQWIRIISRLEFRGYAVEDGKSQLWFRSRAVYTQQNIFGGIVDAIQATALPGGITNRWLLDVDLLPYHPSESSLWRPSAFADYWASFDRCMFYAPEIAYDKRLLWHGALGQATSGGNLMSEFPSGWRYSVLGQVDPYGANYLNEIDTGGDPGLEAVKVAFYKSCRIYEPAVEVESAETVEEHGDTWVKLTLVRRLHCTAGETGGAPIAIDRDVSTWDAAIIAAEPFRTLENGLRLYLLNQSTAYNPTAKTGDNAINSGVQGLPDNPYASIYPRFYLTRLVPEPHRDQNATQDASDTPLWHDILAYAETVLRAICEGYIDHQRSADEVCAYWETHEAMPPDWRHHGWTWEHLCYRAFGRRWVTLTPTEPTGYTDLEQTRAEGPQGFGPIAGQALSAETFNQLAAATDLLDSVRVMLPFALQARRTYHWGDRTLSRPEVDECDSVEGPTYYGAHRGDPPPAVDLDPVSDSDWVDMSSGDYLDAVARSLLDFNPSTFTWRFLSNTKTTEWRFSLVDEDAKYAVPEAWRDMLHTDTGGVFLREEYQQIGVHAPGSPIDCGGPISFDCNLDLVRTDLPDQCLYLKSGSLDAGAPAPGWVWIGYDSAGAGACDGGSTHAITLTPLSIQPEVVLTVPLVAVTRL